MKKTTKRINKVKADKAMEYIISNKEALKIINNAINNGVLLWLETGTWGNRSQLPKQLATEMFGNDEKAINAVHKLVDPNAINNVVQPMRQAYMEIRKRCLPWFSRGVYFIRKDHVQEIDDLLKSKWEETQEKLGELEKQWDSLQCSFKCQHPKLYNPLKYPSKEQLKAKFKLKWGWAYIAVPDGGNAKATIISKEMMEREQKKYIESIKDAAETGINQVRSSFLEIIQHMSEVLKDGKTFRESSIEKPIKFLEDFKNLNIWQDKPFEEFSKTALKMLSGVSSDILRSDDGYRAEISKITDGIVDEFKSLPTVKLERELIF